MFDYGKTLQSNVTVMAVDTIVLTVVLFHQHIDHHNSHMLIDNTHSLFCNSFLD